VTRAVLSAGSRTCFYPLPLGRYRIPKAKDNCKRKDKRKDKDKARALLDKRGREKGEKGEKRYSDSPSARCATRPRTIGSAWCAAW
jgi:hypothetical protein